jgi:glutamate-1-semialdehyde 2,1-aminomutase
MFSTFFSSEKVTDYASAKNADTERFGTYFHKMLQQGVYIAPSQFEAGFISLAHADEDINQTVAAARQAFKAVT